MKALRLVPITFKAANEFVRRFHRNHKPVVGHKFSLAVAIGEEICGVAIVGRPVARMADDGKTLEVNRLCTTGAKNACSMLYSAAWRAAQPLGYQRLITYTLPSEGGASLRAAGWALAGDAGGGSWSREDRKREDKAPLETKHRWEKTL